METKRQTKPIQLPLSTYNNLRQLKNGDRDTFPKVVDYIIEENKKLRENVKKLANELLSRNKKV